MGGWELNFCYKVLQRNKYGWGFFLNKSYVTLTIFILCTFGYCIRFFYIVIIYIMVVRNFDCSFGRLYFLKAIINKVHVSLLKFRKGLTI